jgi:hypothetical protein
MGLRLSNLGRAWGVVALVFSIAACGGGGGGSNPPSPASPTPPAATYSVSGTVNGLTNPFVLQVSGGADVTVNANGPITFMSGVASGTSYAVTVRTQPSAPRQDCTVANGAGTVSANVDNVAIECIDVPLALSSSTPMHAATAAARSGDIVLTFSLPLDANIPPTAVALRDATGVVPTTFTTSGNQMIVKPAQRLLPVMAHTLTVDTQVHGAGGEAMTAPAVVSFTTADGTWGQAQIIETSPGSVPAPQLAVRSNGEAIAIWQDTDLANQLHHTVKMNRYVAGAGWDALPRNIAYSAGGGTIKEPRIALAASGDAIVVWAQDDDGAGSGFNSVAANRRAAGADWNSNDATFLEGTELPASNPQIALNAIGRGFAVWDQSDSNSRTNVWARSYSPNGGWGVPTLVETSNASFAGTPHVAVAANGDAVVAWLQLENGFYSVWANRFGASSGWSGAALLETDDGQANAVQVALSATGDAIVIWRHDSISGDSIRANHYVVGRGWGDHFSIGPTSSFASGARVAFDADGDAIVVWSQQEDPRYDVWARRYVAGTGWGEAELLNTGDDGNALNPQIAFDPRGNALVVWEQHDGTRKNLWARRYVAANAWSAPVLIETEDAGDAIDSQIGVDADGNAIAIWRQDDGTRYNIWANRFE